MKGDIMAAKYEEVSSGDLRWRCDISYLKFKTTAEVSKLPHILGQSKAVHAIQTGLDMDFHGYNIFVSGASGTGRNTTVKHLLANIKNKSPELDIAYVNNFQNSDMPIALYFKAGKGSEFKKKMERLVDQLRTSIPQMFESEKYQKQRESLAEQFDEKQKQVIQDFEKKARNLGFAIVQIQVGPYTRPDVLPVLGDKPVSLDQIAELVQTGKMSQEDFNTILKNHKELSKDLAQVFKENQNLQNEKEAKLAELDHNIVKPIIEGLVNEVAKNNKTEKIRTWLDSVQTSLLENLALFRRNDGNGDGDSKRPPMDIFLPYRVNLIVNNAGKKKVPIVFENTPSFTKLFGTIDRVMDANGQWQSDFTKIRAGSLLLANGGYLVLHAVDTLMEKGVWNTLKRVLKTRKTEILGYDYLFFTGASAIKPEPIDVDVKVIMIGDPWVYRALFQADQEFEKIFKIKADFDSVMDNDRDNILKYAEFINRMCDMENLLPFDKNGIAAVTEYGVRLSGRQKKLSARFNQIADLLRESSHIAAKMKNKVVTTKHVDKAIDEKINRLNLTEEKIQELISEGIIMICTSGSKVGQVNGLSIIDLGDYTFGRPSRITAQVSIGRSGIINIEREAELSGPSHNKGVLILAGYLQGKFAQDKPLAINASLCFEQSYSGVDGDSASSTEIYALLSILSGIPIRQDLAVTGSVNQFGEIQPIGGVNEKIEGFFKVCQAQGQKNSQGVIIPRLNAKDLMLSKEVVTEVEKGRFHIYPIDTIEQGIEILTGIPAGKKGKNGAYPPDTIFGKVDAKLTQYADILKNYSVQSI